MLELAEGLAGPWAVTLLGDLGADVLKIEVPRRMDLSRGPLRPPEGLREYPKGIPGARPWNRNASIVRCNRNKRSITLDLKKTSGIGMFLGLVSVSDVVLTNMTSRALHSLGVTYDALRRIRPDVIFLASSGYGANGPYASNVAMGQAMEGISGSAWIRNYPDEPVSTVRFLTFPDVASASANAFAVVAALAHRMQTGQGSCIDVAGAEAMIGMLPEPVMDYTMNGRIWGALGNAAGPNECRVVHGCYQCRGEDQWVVVSVGSDEQWRRLCAILERPEWASLDLPRRASLQTDIEAVVKAWTTSRDKYDVMHALQRAGVDCGVVMDGNDCLSDPQFREDGAFQLVETADLEPVYLLTPPWKLDGKTLPVRLPPPALGVDNTHVYSELLGVTEGGLRRLTEEGHFEYTDLSPS